MKAIKFKVNKIIIAKDVTEIIFHQISDELEDRRIAYSSGSILISTNDSDEIKKFNVEDVFYITFNKL